MATYKVIQDIEAEDKLVGPLTLRQFIYAAITVVCLYICFLGITKHAIFLVPVFLPIGAVSAFFAFPWGREQPTEIWALAKIRFMIKPRRRIWDQSGIKELVTVTAPKKVEQNLSNGLSQTEVRSRLRALADTIDSRGWAIKNVNVNLYAQPALGSDTGSDRLISVANVPDEVSSVDVRASDDMLDPQNNPVAQQFDTMIAQSEQAHRQQIMQQINQIQSAPQQSPSILPEPQTQASQGSANQITNTQQVSSPNNYWFLQQQPAMPNTKAQVVQPGTPEDAVPVAAPAEPTPDEKALAERLRHQNDTQRISYAHLHTIQPLSAQKASAPKPTIKPAPAAPVTHQPDPAIIALASNNDLNVATIARQANKQNQEPPDEVVISLH